MNNIKIYISKKYNYIVEYNITNNINFELRYMYIQEHSYAYSMIPINYNILLINGTTRDNLIILDYYYFENGDRDENEYIICILVFNNYLNQTLFSKH